MYSEQFVDNVNPSLERLVPSCKPDDVNPERAFHKSATNIHTTGSLVDAPRTSQVTLAQGSEHKKHGQSYSICLEENCMSSILMKCSKF